MSSVFELQNKAFAIIQTWQYNNTKGSLLIVVISHAASNTVSIFVPMASTTSNEHMDPYIAYVVFEVIAATVLIIISGPAQLSRIEPKQIQE